jgi:lamin tail-like protein
MRGALTAIAALLFVFTASAQQTIVINEVCADNQAGFNIGGAYPDYIELYNTTLNAVAIAGMRLVLTNFDDPNKTYIIPTSTPPLPARTFLLLVCDEQTNRLFHTGFTLERKGGHLFLLSPSGTIIRDQVRFGFQIPDRSFGRIPDGTNGVLNFLCFPTPGFANVQAPTGFRNRVKINEWMPSRDTQPDWFEIYNPEPNPIILDGLVFSDRLNTGAGLTNKVTITNSFMEGYGFLRFNADDKPGEGNDELDFKLSSGGDQIVIFARNKTTIFHRIFWPDPTGKEGWPAAAELFISYGWLPDGNTNDLVVRFPLNRDTPEASNFLPIENVLINEVLAHSDPPLEDAIELYNPTGLPVDIGGWWLSDDQDVYNKFRIPTGTRIDPGGYVVFYEQKKETFPPGFNMSDTAAFPDFALSSSQGDQVYLFAIDPVTGKLNGYRRGVDFPATQNGQSYGRYITSTGESDFVPMERLSFGTDVKAGDPTNRLDEFRSGRGAPNPVAAVGALVINEIMYHPPDIISGTNVFQNELDEYIEIYNRSTNRVYLYDTNVYPYPPYGMVYTNTWHVRGEADFDFPTNVSLGPGQSLLLVNFVVNTNPPVQSNVFVQKFAVPANVQIFGPYRGNLSDGGGTITIERPDAPQLPGRPDEGFVPYLRVDRVRYNDDPPWPPEPDGMPLDESNPNSIGYVLTRKKPELYGGDVFNWMSAVPTAGRQYISNYVSRVGDVITVGFEGVAGSSYTIQCRDALEGATWQNLQHMPAQTNSGPREITVTPPPARRFYRVVTPMQP